MTVWRVGNTLALALTILLVATGCATVGRTFNHTEVPNLELGRLKDQQYRTVFGQPWNTQTTSNVDGKFEDVRFLYAYADVGSATARLLDLEFRNGALNGWLYVSGFDEDRTVVDVALADKVRRAVHKRDDVRAILGNPHGKALCPTLLVDYKDRCKSVEIWAWGAINKLQTLGRNPIESSMVYVSFDSDGTVSQLETVRKTSERQR